MGNLDEAIALARKHVEEGRRIVERQRKLVAERRSGPDGLALLRSFERSLEIFEGDLDRLLKQQDRPHSDPWLGSKVWWLLWRHHRAMARSDWRYVLSIAGTWILTATAICVLLWML